MGERDYNKIMNAKAGWSIDEFREPDTVGAEPYSDEELETLRQAAAPKPGSIIGLQRVALEALPRLLATIDALGKERDELQRQKAYWERELTRLERRRIMRQLEALDTKVREQEEALRGAERALADAERIIESRTGRDSWVGSLVLERIRQALASSESEPR
jgi:hypothetical protein